MPTRKREGSTEEIIRRQRETVAGFVRALKEADGSDWQALQALVKAKGCNTPEHWAVELMWAAIRAAKEQATRVEVRQVRFSDGFCRRYAASIAERLRLPDVPGAECLALDMNNGNMEVHKRWPAQRAGVAMINLRQPEELQDAAGQYTAESVWAYCRGWRRPDPDLSKARG